MILKKMNKRGDVTDYITFLIIIFFLAVSLLVAAFVNNVMKEVITGTDINNTDVAEEAVNQIDNIIENTTDNGFTVIFAFLIIGMLVSSFLVRVHPVFIFLYIIFLAVSIFVAIPLANTYQLLVNNPAFASVGQYQIKTTWFLEHITKILLGVGAMTMIVTFGKLLGRNPSGGGDI